MSCLNTRDIRLCIFTHNYTYGPTHVSKSLVLITSASNAGSDEPVITRSLAIFEPSLFVIQSVDEEEGSDQKLDL